MAATHVTSRAGRRWTFLRLHNATVVMVAQLARGAPAGLVLDEAQEEEEHSSPEVRVRELEGRIDHATSASALDLVGWRCECLALTQIAWADVFQLGRASFLLARAYLDAGMPFPAIPHAERAESMLLASAARPEAEALLPKALLALADSLSRAVLAPGRRGRTSQKARGNAATLYKRAADAYHRSLLAMHRVFGRGHVACCPVLRGWARMAVGRSSDFALARRLLARELQIRSAKGVNDPTAAESAALDETRRELASNMLLEAKVASSGHDNSPNSLRAARLRREAIALLAGSEVEAAPAGTMEAARLRLQLAEACIELEAWGQAEAALVSAIGYTEHAFGCCDHRSAALWAELASIRMRQQRHEAAAADYEHVVTVLELLHGPHDERLIAPCEKLCHALVALGRWRDARCQRAHARPPPFTCPAHPFSVLSPRHP